MPAVLTKKETDKRFQVVFDYLCGEQIAQIKTTLANHSYTKSDFKKIKLTVSDNPFDSIDPRLHAIFQVLNIQNEARQKKIIKESGDLYTFLLRLRANQDIYHLKRLIQLIDKTKKKAFMSWWTKSMLFLGSLLVGSSIFDFVDPKRFQTVLVYIGKGYTLFKTGLKSIFQVAKNFALFAIALTTVTTLYKFVRLYRSKSKSKHKKIKSAAYTLITSGLTLTAYLLSFFALGVATPIVSILMVASNLMSILKNVHSLRAQEKAFKKGPVSNDPEDKRLHYGERAAYQRSLSSIQQHRSTLWTKIGIALLSTAVIAAWIFFPPSLLLTAFCIGSLLILGTVKNLVVKAIKQYHQNRLQTVLDEMPDALNEVSPKLALLSKRQSDDITITEDKEELEIAHHHLRLKLPKAVRIEDRMDVTGPYKHVFFPAQRERAPEKTSADHTPDHSASPLSPMTH